MISQIKSTAHVNGVASTYILISFFHFRHGTLHSHGEHDSRNLVRIFFFNVEVRLTNVKISYLLRAFLVEVTYLIFPGFIQDSPIPLARALEFHKSMTRTVETTTFPFQDIIDCM